MTPLTRHKKPWVLSMTLELLMGPGGPWESGQRDLTGSWRIQWVPLVTGSHEIESWGANPGLGPLDILVLGSILYWIVPHHISSVHLWALEHGRGDGKYGPQCTRPPNWPLDSVWVPLFLVSKRSKTLWEKFISLLRGVVELFIHTLEGT